MVNTTCDKVKTNIVDKLKQLRWDLYLIVERGVEDRSCDKWYCLPAHSRKGGLCAAVWNGTGDLDLSIHVRSVMYDYIIDLLNDKWRSQGKNVAYPLPGVNGLSSITMYNVVSDIINTGKLHHEISGQQFVDYCYQRIALIGEVMGLIESMVVPENLCDQSLPGEES